MDLIGFITTWFWYVMAFCAGGLLAWLVARQFVRAESPGEAIDEALDNRADGDRDEGDDDGPEAPRSRVRVHEADDVPAAGRASRGRGTTNGPEVRR